MYPRTDGHTTFKYPSDRHLPLRDMITEELMHSPDMLDHDNGANLLSIAVGHSLDTLNHVLGEFADLSALSDLRRPRITIEETGEQIRKTASDQIAVFRIC